MIAFLLIINAIIFAILLWCVFEINDLKKKNDKYDQCWMKLVDHFERKK